MPDKEQMERSIYARRIDLTGYLPPFIAQYREVQALMQAENAEFAALLDALKGLLDDLFIQTANERALVRYERIMGVRSAAGESVETRRLRLLLACARAKKNTISGLVAAAAVLGEMIEVQVLPGHVLLIDFISGDEGNIAVLREEFAARLPAHMEIQIRNVTKLEGTCAMGGTMGLSMEYCFEEV